MLFNDIRSFTTLIENRPPEAAFAFVNNYWKFMVPIIRSHRGNIDQYQGGAILAIFPHETEDTVSAGLSMLDGLAEFNRLQLENHDVAIHIGD